jgi:tRNA threonylcarbamoyl adenosine modification protein (Sua5/YciO/YrdC/YwlC family)
MMTDVLVVAAPGALETALAFLRDGEVIALPTDTVYGVAVDGLNPYAIEKLYAVKARPMDKAIPLLLASPGDLSRVVVEIPEGARILANAFWPGALTLVVRARETVPLVLRAEGDTVAVRVPDHPVPRQLARMLGHPLAATSANISGERDPSTAREVEAQLGGRISLILDGGAVGTGLPSTVVDCTVAPPRVLRVGALAVVEIERALADKLADGGRMNGHLSSVFRRSSLVGLDASRALTAAPTGTETYSRELIRALLQADSPFRFRLYVRDTPPLDFFPKTGNYEIRTIPFPRLWTHLRLSGEMLAHPPDVLFVPAHVLPPVHPRRSLVTVHDLGYRYFPQAHRALDRWYLDLSTRWNARAAACVIADSNATRDDIVRFYGIPREKIRVVYPALAGNLFRPVREAAELARVRSRYQLDAEYLITVGTLHPRKNYERLLQAFARLPEKYQLVIAGKKGWLFHPVFATVKRLGLEPRVRFLDYVEAADLPALYSAARLSVFPSLYEGFGFPVLEAQACGVPVVCSNTSSLPEVAGDAAEFFDPREVEAMAAAMARVLNDEARRDELIQKGCLNLQRFSWARAAREILEAINSLMPV